MSSITLETIHDDLEFLKREINELKEHMVDMDIVLTDDDIESIKSAEKDFKEGRTRRLIDKEKVVLITKIDKRPRIY